MGYIFTSSRNKPNYGTWVIAEEESGYLSRPANWSFVWDDQGTGAPRDGSIWTPSAPSGYNALGSVALHCDNSRLAGHSDFPDIVCVRNDLVRYATLTTRIWDDGGSGGKNDGSVWGISESEFAKGASTHASQSGAGFACLNPNSKLIKIEY